MERLKWRLEGYGHKSNADYVKFAIQDLLLRLDLKEKELNQIEDTKED